MRSSRPSPQQQGRRSLAPPPLLLLLLLLAAGFFSAAGDDVVVYLDAAAARVAAARRARIASAPSAPAGHADVPASGRLLAVATMCAVSTPNGVWKESLAVTVLDQNSNVYFPKTVVCSDTALIVRTDGTYSGESSQTTKLLPCYRRSCSRVLL
jgi:hypothetical protein